MIIETPASAGDFSSSKMLQQTKPPVVEESPPAYSDIHGAYNGQGSGMRRQESYRIPPMRRERSRRRRQPRNRDQGAGFASDYDMEHTEQPQPVYNHGPGHGHPHGHRHDRRHDRELRGRELAPPPSSMQRPSMLDLQAKSQPAIPAEQMSPLSGSPLSEGHEPRARIPMPSSDQIHISDHRHEIKGSFFVDPTIELLDPSRRKKKCKDNPPHASFRTRNQEIDISLATTGNIQKAPKANVAVSSGAGHIKVKLLPMRPTCPRIGLDVQSRHGDIVVFIPDNYVGVIQLSTRKGKLQVLPALASHMKVVKSSENDMLFMIGEAHQGADASREASFCELSSRTGTVIVGLSNRDSYAPKPGFWKRMGSLLKGESPQ